MPLARNLAHKITEDEYLQGELSSNVKHEYIDGVVYAMVGASTKHNIISVNITSDLQNKLKQKKSPCNTFTSDMKVKINKENPRYFYPDVMVACNVEEDNEDEYFQNNPLIIFEVLSHSTEKYDKSQKRLAYFSIPSLKEYVLVEQNKCEVIVFECDKNWQSNYYFLGDTINIESLGLTLSVEDIYYQVNGEEFKAYTLEKDKEREKTLKQSNN